MGNALRCNKSSDKRVSRRLVALGPKVVWQSAVNHVASLSHATIWGSSAGHVALFLVKVAALEMLRRFSRDKCPFVWHSLQAFQVLCYPPFKWIQRWAPFKGLVQSIQAVSKPLLALSIATAFSDEADRRNGSSGDSNGSDLLSEQQSESSFVQSVSDVRARDEIQYLPSESWLVKLRQELENQGLDLPERINDEELRRFYSAANGDFASLLSSVKKTIRWRETYRILSEEELEMWSNLVFWHGFDLHCRPCLVVRLGLACLSLPSEDKPRFAQAIISQIEHGALHLVDLENPQITVLVDCEGLTPLRVPMQLLRSCSSHLQDHFPNRLGYLFVIRLPPVVRVIAQTFIQVLKPATGKKLRIEGGMYKKTLLEHLRTLPTCLGGQCTCVRCSDKNLQITHRPYRSVINNIEPVADISDREGLPIPSAEHETNFHSNVSCDQVLRTAIIGVLMLWLFIAVIAGIYDPESQSFLAP